MATPGGIGFPHAQQAVRITRTRTVKGKTTRETAYLTVSRPADQAQPTTELGTWARSEWHIENRLHYIRDVTLGEDAQRPRTGNGPPSWPHSVTPRSATALSMNVCRV